MKWLIKYIVKQWMIKWWGRRCYKRKKYQQGCPSCEAWKSYDYIFGE